MNNTEKRIPRQPDSSELWTLLIRFAELRKPFQKIMPLSFFVFALMSYVICDAQTLFMTQNIRYQYDLTEDIHAESKVYNNQDTLSVFILLTFNKDKKIGDYEFTLQSYKNYNTVELISEQSLNNDSSFIKKSDHQYLLYQKISIPQAKLLVLKAHSISRKKDYLYDVKLIDENNYPKDGIILYDKNDLPVLKNFVKINNELRVSNLFQKNLPVFVYFYSMDFEEAIPPMVTEEGAVSKNMMVDTLFTIQPDSVIKFEKPGLYYFQMDTSTTNGLAIRIEDEYYPLCKTFNSVLEPLIYISTKEETDIVRSIKDSQKAFESFWMKLKQDKEKAKIAIKNYYDQVEGANYLFTSYKEGWKSDMGMIYTVYGPPDEVYRSENIEDWVYNHDITMPVIRFSFYKVKNIFADNHFTLLRKSSLDKNWFKAVEIWRKGTKN